MPEKAKKGWMQVQYPADFGFVLPVGWGIGVFAPTEETDWVLCAAGAGKLVWRVGEREVEQKGGEILFAPSGISLLRCEDSDWRAVGVGGGMELGLALLGGRNFLVCGDSDGGISRGVMHLCFRLSSSEVQSPYRSSTRIYKLLLDLLEVVREEKNPLSELVREAVELLEREFAYIGGVEDLADRLEVHKSHLIRCFSEQMGVSPGKYLQKVRLEYGKLLLCYKSYDLETVADLLGYSGANYFCKVFRQGMGMTPGEYRRLNQAKVGQQEPEKLLEWEKKLHL